MIQLSRNYSLPERADDSISIKIIGVGGAGSNVLDRIVLDGVDKSDLIAANTDVQALASSVAAHKVQLGRELTRGLGTGGDPELGFQAAREAAEEIRGVLSEAQMVFVCAGLGGGSGSGAASVIAELAQESGALVVAFVALPFGFEGKRRAAQAQQALVRLGEVANAVICFENDKMGDIVAPKAGIHQAFAAADAILSQSVRSIVNLIQRPGLIRLGFDDLRAALCNPNARCLFGYGESDTDNRAHDALTQALKSPLMDRGRLLADASRILVQVAGGPGMTLSEVEILMQDLNRHVGDETQILFGTSVDGRMGNRLAVTIITSLVGEDAPAPLPVQKRKAAAVPVPPPAPEPVFAMELPEPVLPEPEPVAEPVAEEEIFAEEERPPLERPLQTIEAILPEPASFEDEIESPAQVVVEPIASGQSVRDPEPIPDFVAEVPPEPAPPRVLLPKKKPAPAPIREPKPDRLVAKQEVMQFESVTRGRFEKSEPTIVEGQDLDVPTFLRKNVRVK